MKTQRTPKKKPEEIQRDPVREISLSPEDWQEFEHGVTLFNNGKFWNAHEAWELVWQQHTEDERLFFQGLIQLAAAYHQLTAKQNYRAMFNNFEKAEAKLEVFQPEYLGINVLPLLKSITDGKHEIDRIQNNGDSGFNIQLVPKIQFHKPGNPDLLVEIKDILRNDQFLEGVKLYNAGYYWEAHEAWEDVWRSQEGDAKTFVQGFVEIAGGCSFLKLSKVPSALYLFGKGIEKFHQFENLNIGFPLKQFVGEFSSSVYSLQAHPNGQSAGRPVSFPRITLTKK